MSLVSRISETRMPSGVKPSLRRASDSDVEMAIK